MPTLSAAHATIEAMIITGIKMATIWPGSMNACRTPAALAAHVVIDSATIVPIMNTSPWAKLMSSMMPYTSV